MKNFMAEMQGISLKRSFRPFRPFRPFELRYTNHIHRTFIVVIHQNSSGYREFLGMNRKKLEPGIRLNIPILHSTVLVELREQSASIENIVAYTKDNVPVVVSGNLYFKVTNVHNACYNVTNPQESTINVGKSTIRSIIGTFDYDRLVSERNEITKKLIEVVGNSIKDWGMDCTKFEMQTIKPQDPQVDKQLLLQMEAERRKRENELDTDVVIKTADGEKQAKIKESEGHRTSIINVAQANYDKAKLEAEGSKFLIQKETEAYKQQLQELATCFNGNLLMAAEFILENKRLDKFGHIASNGNSTYFVDPKSVLPSIKVFSDLLHTKSSKPSNTTNTNETPSSELKDAR